MSIIGSNAVLVSSDQIFDPQAGWQVEEQWAGTDSALSALANAYALAGSRVRYGNRGGQRVLIATVGTVTPGSTEVPSDSFTLHKAFVQASLWSGSKIISLVRAFANENGYTGEHGFEDALAFLQREMETAMAGKVWDSASSSLVQVLSGPWSPTDLTLGTVTAGSATYTWTPWSKTMLDIYKLMLQQGTTHGGYEIERPGLQRLRTYSAAYSQRMKLDRVPKVYTTSSLVSLFSIPALIAAQLPDDPPTADLPSNSAWGWKVRNEATDIRWGGKFEERKEWVFWAWSTILYDLV